MASILSAMLSAIGPRHVPISHAPQRVMSTNWECFPGLLREKYWPALSARSRGLTQLCQDKQTWLFPAVPPNSVILNCSSLQHHRHGCSLQLGASMENYMQLTERENMLNKLIHCPLHLSSLSKLHKGFSL